ncbi:hypothetical protein ACP4OV_010412 [Aristida adscensionis]
MEAADELLMVALGVALLLLFLCIFWPTSQRALGNTIKVRDPAIARDMLINQAAAFSNRPSTPFPVALITGRRRRSRSHGITTVPYGPHWRALRCNLTAAVLQPWRLGRLAPLQHEATDALLAALRSPGHTGDAVVVIRDSLYTAVFALLTRVCFGGGIDTGHVHAMQRMMQEFRVAIGEARAFAGSPLARLLHRRRWRRFLAFRDQQAALFLPLIHARWRRSSCGGIRPYVDSLIDLRVPDDNAGGGGRALTDDEMVSLVVEFLGATESIVACVEWTLAHLVTQPEVQRKLRQEVTGADDPGDGDERLGRMPYLHAVVLECLRLHPPFPLILRDVHAEGAAGSGTTAPAGGTKVYFVLKDIARDRKAWTDPDEFRPERFVAGGEGQGVGPLPGSKEMRMMPFGAGHRSCPGAGLGMLYVKRFLAVLLREFEWAPPAEGCAGVDMAELFGFIAVMKTPLTARITPVT